MHIQCSNNDTVINIHVLVVQTCRTGLEVTAGVVDKEKATAYGIYNDTTDENG